MSSWRQPRSRRLNGVHCTPRRSGHKARGRSATASNAIGTDVPGLPLSRLDDAREALRTADAVIGPTDDGGFYLIGVSACPHGLLDSVPWSAPDTCAHTLERLGQHQLTTTVIDPWFDVDEPADLDALRRRIRDGTIHAPETARILGEPANANLPRAGL